MQATKDIYQFSTLKDGEILTVDFATVKKTLPFNGSFLEMEDGFYEKGNATPGLAACAVEDEDIKALQGWGNPSTIITSLGTNRQPGNSSLTKEQIVSHKQICFWTLEMRCIVKPIETFLFADEKAKLTSRDKKKKWLAARAAMLKSWENLKAMRFIKPWLELCYVSCGDMEDDYDDGKKGWRKQHPYSTISVPTTNPDGTTTKKSQQTYYLTRWARAIACKKMRGITTYNYYYPVISCTRMSDEPFPDVKSDGMGKNELGHVVESLDDIDAYTWSPYSTGGSAMCETIRNLLNSYQGDDKLSLIKIADKVSRNGDGSYRRNEQWCAINREDWKEYCTDLYPQKGNVLI